MRLSGAIGVCFGLLSIAFASAAHAKPKAGDVLTIDVSASIAQRCGVEAHGQRSNDTGRIDRATSISFNFRLDCNTPFRIGVSAQNGALTLASANGAIRDAAGFQLSKKYTVGLSFLTDQNGLVDVGSCSSDSLGPTGSACQFFGAQPGQGYSPGRQVTAIGRDGSLQVSWSGEDNEPVRHAAGEYQDALTIVVGPRT